MYRTRVSEEGIQVCDMGCSGGETVFALAEKFPRSTFCGIDVADEPIELARRDADQRGEKQLSSTLLSHLSHFS